MPLKSRNDGETGYDLIACQVIIKKTVKMKKENKAGTDTRFAAVAIVFLTVFAIGAMLGILGKIESGTACLVCMPSFMVGGMSFMSAILL